MALEHMEQAHDKAEDQIGTRMMLDEVIDDLRSLITRYQRINGDDDG